MRSITITSDIKDVRGLIQEARSVGKLGEISDQEAHRAINEATFTLLNPPRDPSGDNIVKCKKKCSSSRATGKCVLGGCFTLKGFPPKKFSWTWEI